MKESDFNEYRDTTKTAGATSRTADTVTDMDNKRFRRVMSAGTLAGDHVRNSAGEDLGIAIIAAMREAVGPSVEILVDAHGHYNVPTAVRLARRLELCGQNQRHNAWIRLRPT